MKNTEKYVAQIAEALGLGHWTFHLETAPDNEDSIAEIDCVDGAREATITLSPDFYDMDRAEQREVVIHELIHVFQTPCWHMVRTDLPPMVGLLAAQPFTNSYSRAMEYMTDGLAKAIAPHYPLPKA